MESKNIRGVGRMIKGLARRVLAWELSMYEKRIELLKEKIVDQNCKIMTLRRVVEDYKKVYKDGEG